MDAHQSAQEAAQVGLDERDGSGRNQCEHLLPGVEPGDEGGQLSEEVLEHEGPFGTRMGAGGNGVEPGARQDAGKGDRKSTRLNSSHVAISYAVFCLKKKNEEL